MEGLNLIKGYRNMIGLTQQDMADKIGISRDAYNRKESTNNFTKTEKMAIAMVFSKYGLTIEETSL